MMKLSDIKKMTVKYEGVDLSLFDSGKWMYSSSHKR